VLAVTARALHQVLTLALVALGASEFILAADGPATDAAYALFKALGATPTSCATELNLLHEPFEVRCASVRIDLRDFMARTDEVLSAMAAPEGSWHGSGAERSRSFLLNGSSLSVWYHRREGVVVSYPKPYPRCAQSNPELVSMVEPPGADRPVIREETRTPPPYPEFARLARITGRVVLRALVQRDGTLRDVCVERGIRNGGLGFEYVARQTVADWRYEPARLNGQPIDYPIVIIVEFKLH
jgi:TonB family protein